MPRGVRSQKVSTMKPMMASITAVLATRVVQGISSWLFGTLVLLAFGVNSLSESGPLAALEGMAAFAAEQPLLAALGLLLVAALAILIARRGRLWVSRVVRDLTAGGAVLRSPRRYLGLVVAPTILAFILRWGVTATLLAAFSIPVTLETLIRVNVSHGVARSVQVTPGGLGTTQAFDLVALQGVASPEVITADSLAQSAILFVFNLTFAVVALVWAFGWQRAVRLIRERWRPATASKPGEALARRDAAA